MFSKLASRGIATDMYQRNVIGGAEVILLPSMYPAAPATMQPTARPTTMLIFLRNGEPNSSVKIIDMNDRKPRPMNSGEPHLHGNVSLKK